MLGIYRAAHLHSVPYDSRFSKQARAAGAVAGARGVYAGVKVEVRECGEDDFRGQVSRLRDRIYANDRARDPEAFEIERHVEMWDWIRRNPAGLEPKRWMLTDGGEAVGYLASVPQSYRIAGQRVVAHTPADYMVLPGYGFHALKLMREFFRSYDNYVACDQIQSAIEVETRMGAVETGELLHAAKLMDLSRLPRLPKRVPEAPIRLANRALGAVDGVLGGTLGRLPEVEEIEVFDHSFDELFERVASVVSCVPEKDAAFLRWRYGPGSPQSSVTVLGVRDGEGLLGYAVTLTSVDGDDGYLFDLTTLPGHPMRREVTRALLREAVRRFAKANVYIVRCLFTESPASPEPSDLKRMGFFFRGQRRHKLLVGLANRELHGTAAEVENWAYTVGDGEATFWVR